MRAAAVVLTCLLSVSLLAQAPPTAAELIAEFPALSVEESPSDIIADPMIRRETALPGLESAFTLALERVARGEQDRTTRKIRVDQATERAVEAETNVQRARDLLRDANVRIDLSHTSASLGVTSGETANYEAVARRDAEDAQTALDKALAELGKRKLEVENTEKKLREAEESLRRLTTSTASLTQQRQGWISENDPNEAPAYDGAPIERNVVLIQFAEGAEIATIYDVLKRHHLRVRSGIADIRLFITTITDADAAEPAVIAAARVRRIVANLAREESVVAASPNMAIGPEIVPGPTNLEGSAVACWNWFGACSGSMAAKALRVPAAWNLNDAISRRARLPIRIAVLDEGFEEHRDLVYDSVCTSTRGTHGNHVMGIIGATWGNGEGIDGGTRFAKLLACSPGKLAAATPVGMTLLTSRILWTLHRILASPSRRPRVVNVSLGYNWVAGFGDGTSPDDRVDLQLAVAAQGSYVRALMRLFGDVMVVSSAGNDCGGRCTHAVCAHQAKWSSPFNWAALAEGIASPNIVVVESLDDARRLSRFSCRNGQIAAPGENVVSTLTTRRPATEAEAEFGLAAYGTASGTSQAAPAVTAVIGLMLAYDPTLTPAEIRSALQIGTTPNPIADAYEAVILAGGKRAIKDLADLDGSGRVDIADFHIFAKRMREVENLAGDDRDGNNVIDPLDFRFLREDLNGDDFLNRMQKKFVPTLGLVTDLEVMKAVWEDATVDKNTLEGRLGQ